MAKITYNPAPHAAAAAAGGGPIYSTMANVVVGVGGVAGGAIVTAAGGGAGAYFPQNPGAFSFTTNIQPAHKISRLGLNSLDAPEGETFKSCLDLFTVDMRLDGEDANHQHYLVWTRIFGEEFPDYGVVLRDGLGVYPAFGSETTRKHFVEWFAEYDRTFFKNHDIYAVKIPILLSGDLKGIWIEDKPDYSSKTTTSMYVLPPYNVADWTWIVAHCKHPVIRVANGWLFESDTDAIIFKMR